MNNQNIKSKGLVKKATFFSCFGSEFNMVFFVWKMIILSSIVFIFGVVFSFGVFKKEQTQNVASKSDVTIINSLTLNRGMLSDVFEAYKKQEEFFNSDLKTVDSLLDPS